MAAPLQDHALSDLSVENGSRPAKPDLGPVAPGQRHAGQHLAAIHRHYLQDLSRMALVLRRIEAGDAPPEELAAIVLNAEMAQNFRAFGTLCGQQCHMLTMHHDIEESALFPQLHQRGSAEVRAVVDRLRAEHEVVHELLERLAASAQDLTRDPSKDQFAKAAAIFSRLVDVVQSHFHYEETMLEEALGVYGVMV